MQNYEQFGIICIYEQAIIKNILVWKYNTQKNNCKNIYKVLSSIVKTFYQILSITMIPYLITQFHRTPYQFLNIMGFQTSNTFMNNTPDFDTLRTFIKNQQKQIDREYISKCLEILGRDIQKPKQMMTVLIFVHLLLQTLEDKSDQLLSLLNQQINQILNKKHQYCLSKHNRVFKKYSLTLFTQPQTNVGDQQFGTQPEIGEQPRESKINRAMSAISEMGSSFSRKPSFNSSIQDKKPHQYVSEKQVLCQKLIQPYACYLLRKCTSDFQDKTKDRQIIGEDIYFWHLANQLKNLFKITQNYYVVLRYYEQKYLTLILNLTNLLSYQIHQCYPKITELLKSKLHTTIKQLNTSINPNTIFIMSNKQNISSTINETKQKTLNVDLMEMKLLLKEVDQINQSLISFYMNKYLSVYLRIGFVKMPELMNLDSVQCQIVYFYIKEQEERVQRQMARKFKIGKRLSNMENFSGFIKRASILETDCDNFITVAPETMTLNRIPLNRKNSEKFTSNPTPLNQRKFISEHLILLKIDEEQPNLNEK